MASNLSLLTRIQQALPIWDVPDPKYVAGFDTSQYSGVVDFSVAKAAGDKFVIIKMLDGKFVSKYAEENYKGAKDNGFLIGGYQWLYKENQVSPGGQARAFTDFLADHPVDIRPAVDFEWSPNGKQYNVDTGDLYGWAQPFQDVYGKIPMIYSALGYWNQFGSSDPRWANYPLWTAQYRVGQPSMFAPFTQWKFWQFSANVQGSLHGFPLDGEKAIDFDYWCGTLTDLLAWCGGVGGLVTPVPQTPPVPTGTPQSVFPANYRVSVAPDGSATIAKE